MARTDMTLTLDNVQVRATVGIVKMSGWMQVLDVLPKDTEMVLMNLQEGTREPWLAPRHEWMLKDGAVWAHFENLEPGMLWEEQDRWAHIASKGIMALERIIDIIYATNQSASWALLAEGADRIRNAGLPIIIDEGKE